MKKLFLLFIVTIPFLAEAQKKIKYKDLYPLLEEKNYIVAEEQLREFLANDKNLDEGNALYHMGLIFKDKYDRYDVLTDTTTFFTLADSANYFLNQALIYIDEKELKKNDEYYQSFYRRDLRTGEFAIKLSDVHLDIENLIEEVENRRNETRNLYMLLAQIKSYDQKEVELFNALISNYESINNMYFEAGLDEISTLGSISDVHYTLTETGEKITESAQKLGMKDQYDSLILSDITGFSSLNPKMNPYDGSIEAWNMNVWVSEVKDIINSEVSQFKSQLISIDSEIAGDKEKVVGSVTDNIRLDIPTELIETIEKYNANPTPLLMLNSRILENTFLGLSDTVLNPKYGDSLYVRYQLDISDSLFRLSKKIDSTTTMALSTVNDSEISYSQFFNDRYQGFENVKKYLVELNTWSKQKQAELEEKIAYWEKRNNWGIVENDTIPLKINTVSGYNGPYKVQRVFNFGPSDVFALGIDSESEEGFVIRFGLDRTAIWEQKFDLPFNLGDSLANIKIDSLISGAADLAFYFFNVSSESDKNIILISLNNESGDYNWQVSYNIKKKPEYSTYSDPIKQHTVFLYPEDMYPLPNDELGYIVIDRNGEIR